MSNEHPLSKSEFDAIYSRVPRLTVEIVLHGAAGVYLTKRAIEPCKGLWHLPGGTVRFGEPVKEAVRRIASRELCIDVTATKLLGYIEYPSHYLHGLDSPVGLAFEVVDYAGEISPNTEARDASWFVELPRDMHDEQRLFLIENFDTQ